jgi:hypothetical protein
LAIASSTPRPACLGTVVYIYEDPRLAGEIIAVRFDVGDVPVAVPVDTIKPAPQRRRGGK